MALFYFFPVQLYWCASYFKVKDTSLRGVLNKSYWAWILRALMTFSQLAVSFLI